MSSPGSPIPADDESVDIDTGDVEYDQTGAQPSTTSTSALAKRPLELTDIEGSLKRGVTSALQQRPLFVLDKEIITAADATAFQLQANRWNDNFALSDVIVGRSVDLLDMSIKSDPTFTMLSEADIPRWIELLSVAQAAELVVRHFGARPDSGRTLAENFGNIDFAFNFSDPAYERATMIAMVNLVQSHEQLSGPITPEQHAHLITLIEKRLPPDSQIRTDYFVRRGPRPIPGETWRDAMSRFHRCVGEVRLLMKKYDSYGPPTKLYRIQASNLRTPAPSASAPLARRSAAAAAAPAQIGRASCRERV